MKNYNIVVVGPSGSGKTVFLASMHKFLAVQRGYTRFFIEASPEQRKLLNQKYQEVALPGDWPDSTLYSEVSEWRFKVVVENDAAQNHEAFQFTYIDYAGERITDPAEADTSDSVFESTLRNADSILALLDGKKILSLMENEEDGLYFQVKDLSNILQIVQDIGCPTHFVISKWDLVDGKYSLSQIRDRLKEIDEFREVVNNRYSNGIPIRLIPVSSVGKEFVKPVPDSDLMLKIPGKQPRPFQVEMPLACVLPDQLRTQLEKMKAEQRRIESQSINTAPNLSIFDMLGELAGSALRQVRNHLRSEYQFDDGILKVFIDFVETGAREKREEAEKRVESFRQEKEKSLKLVQDNESAIEHALRSFMFLVGKLEVDFPESNLSRM